MAALLDRHFSEKGQKDAREILALLKQEGADPALAAEILDRSRHGRDYERICNLEDAARDGSAPSLSASHLVSIV